MKKIKFIILMLLIVVLTACCKQDSTPTSVSKEQTEHSSGTAETTEQSSTIFAVGESYVFPSEDSINGGLKITVDSVVFDKTIALENGDSSRNFDGLIPVVVTATFENTTNRYIDIGVFELLDKDGNMGQWSPYVEGISQGSTSGLNSGQKMKIVEVFGSPSEKGIDLTYAYATWRIE